MNRPAIIVALLAVAALPAAPAQASEIFGGIYSHDVKTPLNLSGVEDGVDFLLGFRGGRIGRTPLQPYIFGSLNSAGDTSYAAAGVSAKFGRRIYVRPGLGLAVHNGSSGNFELNNDRVEFGSRILFAPEIAVGTDINEQLSIEASLVHLSHGTIFSGQNPGIDNIGVRLNYAF